MKDMLAELNHMLEQRERGEEPDFDGFMERYGDFFPGNPQTLDELLEQMAQSMAQMQQLLNSMTPEQRAQLQELANSLLDDMDLRWQMDQLGQNLRNAFPQMGWGQGMRLPRRRAAPARRAWARCSTSSATSTRSRTCCATRPTRASSPRSTSTACATCSATTRPRSLQQLAELAKMLEEAGLIEQREGRMELTPKGIRRIGQRALGDLFRRLLQDRAGPPRDRAGRRSVTNAPTSTRPYEFGDPFHLDVGRTIKNAITRAGRGHAGAHHARRLRDRAHRAGHADAPPC